MRVLSEKKCENEDQSHHPEFHNGILCSFIGVPTTIRSPGIAGKGAKADEGCEEAEPMKDEHGYSSR
jgi:hypothetical protein